MLNLPIQMKDGVPVVCSVDLAKLCVPSHTKSGARNKNQHYRLVERLEHVLGLKQMEVFASTYTTSMGNTCRCYMLPEREACLVTMSYSYDLHLEVRDAMRAAIEPTIKGDTHLELTRELALLNKRYELDSANIDLELTKANLELSKINLRKTNVDNAYELAKIKLELALQAIESE